MHKLSASFALLFGGGVFFWFLGFDFVFYSMSIRIKHAKTDIIFRMCFTQKVKFTFSEDSHSAKSQTPMFISSIRISSTRGPLEFKIYIHIPIRRGDPYIV